MRCMIIKGLSTVVVIVAVCTCGAQQHPVDGSGGGLQEDGCQYMKECSFDAKTAYNCVEAECRMCEVMPDKPKCMVVTSNGGSQLIWCCPLDIAYSTIMSGDSYRQLHECAELNKESETKSVNSPAKPDISQNAVQPELQP